MIKNFFRKIGITLYIIYMRIMTMVGISLYNTEQEILKANPNDLNKQNSKTQRMRHRNPLIEKFYAGHSDVKYTKKYYEILKKADKFIRGAKPKDMAIAADKFRMTYGMEDKHGRTHEHYGFYDKKHKNVGKTLDEVLVGEYEERRTLDDDYEIVYIFNNKPIGVGLFKMANLAAEATDGYYDKKMFTFPISVKRDDDNIFNKIEELSEFLHVKKIGFEHRQLEFFIPLKFKTTELEDNSKIFLELTKINNIFVNDEYGKLIGFTINKFKKRIIYNDTHEVWKFNAIEIEDIGVY